MISAVEGGPDTKQAEQNTLLKILLESKNCEEESRRSQNLSMAANTSVFGATLSLAIYKYIDDDEAVKLVAMFLTLGASIAVLFLGLLQYSAKAVNANVVSLAWAVFPMFVLLNVGEVVVAFLIFQN